MPQPPLASTCFLLVILLAVMAEAKRLAIDGDR
jgi:hypothetical protein